MKPLPVLLRADIPEYFVDLALRKIRQYPSESLKYVRNQFKQTSAEAASLMSLLSLDVSRLRRPSLISGRGSSGAARRPRSRVCSIVALAC